MTRLALKIQHDKGNEECEDSVDKDEELRVLVHPLVTLTILIIGGHDLFLEITPSSIGPDKTGATKQDGHSFLYG